MRNNYSNKTSANWFVLACITLCMTFSGRMNAQLTGVKNIPGDYATLAMAIDTLNTYGVGAGGVTLNMILGNPETAPVGGYAITATGTAANPIILQGNGNTITTNGGLVAGSLNDGIFKIIGGDYITITRFIMQENAANTTTAVATNNMTEWGIALLYASTTNGAQNNIIQGNSITLNRTYTNTFGVYSNTRHSATAVTTAADITSPAGANNFNKIYLNTISNVNMGVAFIGSNTAANQDMGNEVGATAANGNTITNWGGAAAATSYISNSGTSYCIFLNHQTAYNVSYNQLTSATVTGTAVTFRGIFTEYTVASPTGTFTSTISNNTITMTDGFTSGTFEAIRSANGAGSAASGVTLNITNNTITNAVTGAASSSALLGIGNGAAFGTVNITDNILQGNTSTATSGGFTGITNTAGVVNAVNLMNNQVGNSGGNAITFSSATSGTVNGISNTGGAATCTVTITGNDFRGIVHSVAGSSTHNYITQTAAASAAVVSNNTFTNLNVNTTGSVNFISHSYSIPATGSMNINNNSIVTGYNKGGAGGTITLSTTNGSSANGAVFNQMNNNFSNITATGATAITGFNNTDGAGTSPTKTITGNTFNNWTTGAGTILAMNYSYIGGPTTSFSGNSITNINGQGAITGFSFNNSFAGTGVVNVSTNIVTGLSSTGTGGTVIGMTCSNTSTTINFNGNTINTLSSTGASSTVSGIIITGSTNTSVFGNVINGILASGATSPVARAIAITGGTLANVYKNKIYDLQANSAGGTAFGLVVSGSTTNNVYNNIIGDVRTPAASAANPLIGMNITGGTTDNIYYNTVYLAGTSTGANFGSSAISASTTPTLNLRNNIFINNSTPAGTGLAVAYRRSSTTLTTYGASSNNNLFYAGTPGAANLIYTDGTNSDQTLAAFQTRVATRDAASVTENVAFLSTSGASANFLHVNSATPTLAESSASNIATYTDDIDGDIRQGNAGYAGTGSAPDIGADEFNGTNPSSCTGTPTQGSITGSTTVCSGSGVTLTLSGASTGPGYTYQWASGTTAGGPYTNMGTALTQATGNLAVTTYYQVTVGCSTSGMSATTTEFTVAVNPNPTVSVLPTTGIICNPGGTAIALTASGATTYTWLPTTGLTPSTGASVSANPASTTTYTVTGTDGVGCSATATTVITVGTAPATPVVSATPASVCSGANSQLLVTSFISSPVNAYTFAAGTGAALDPMVGATTVLTNGDDDNPTLAAAAIGFTFNFNGTNYTQYSVSPDGWILLGGAVASGEYANAVTSTANVPRIYPMWDDLATGTNGSVQTLVTGTAPNRIFKVQWFITSPRNTTGPANGTFQAWMYEATGVVEFRYGTVAAPGSVSAGLTGSATNFQSLTYTTNTSSIATANDGNATAPASGTIYTFTPPQPTYSWTPATFLNSTTIANPLASGITASTNYTVTATSAIGCVATGTVAITAGTALTSTAGATPGTTVCEGTNLTLNSNPAGGGAPYTYVWAGPNSFSSTSQNPVINGVTLAAAGVYTVTVTDNCTATSVNTVTIAINPAPVVGVSPTTGTICNPGGTAITLTASGATTYAWLPATGLTPATGAVVSANPASTTTYTVTGTDGLGCTKTATTVISVGPAPSTPIVTATPASVCVGANSQLLVNSFVPGPVNTYSYVASTGATLDPMTGATTVLTTGNDDTPTGAPAAIGFTFNFNGTNYTQYSVSPDGWILLGGATASAEYTNAVTSVANAPRIYPYWDDLATGTTGNVKTLVTGAAPNRIFIVQWFVTIPRNTGGAANSTFQAWLYEASGAIEFHYGTMGAPGATTVSSGLTATATNYESVTFTTNTINTATPNDANTTVPPAGTMYTFTPPSATYSWSPATFLNNPAIANPLASGITATTSYTATVTSAIGCVSTGTVTITAGSPLTTTLTATPAASVCAGTNVTLTSATAGGGLPYTYTWTGPNSFSSSVQSPVINGATTAATGTYSLTITDNCGSSINSTVSLTVNANPTVAVSPTTALYCNPGTPATLTASGASTYAWLPATGLSAATGTSVDASPAVTTTYTVTGTDGNGCIGTATTAITSAPAVTGATATATPSTICSGSTTALTSSASPYTTTLLTENFNGTAAGWTTTNTSTGGTVAAAAWTLRPNGYNTGNIWSTVLNSNDASQFYLTNSDAQGSGSTTNTTLQSPAFNTVGFTTLNLQFYHFFRFSASPDQAFVEVSTNGTTWTSVQSYTATTGSASPFTVVNVNLNAYVGNPTVYVRFRFTSPWGYGWAIDNVSVNGSSPNFTYAWTSTPAGYTSSVQNPTGVSPMVSTAYDVSVTNIFGCSATASTSVTVNPSPAVALGNDTTVCGGITLDAGNAGNTYLWSDASTAQTLAVTSSGTYYVDVTTALSCTTRDSIVLTVNTPPTVNLGSDITQCGGTTTLDAQNAGSAYLWSDASTAQTLVVSGSGTYFVDVTSPAGCTKRDSIDVTINPVPVVNLGSDVNQCGGTVNLDAQNAGATYLWSDASSGQTLNVTNSGTYFVDVTNGSGCTERDSVDITIRPVPVVALGNDTALCGGTIILDAQNVGSTYLWSDASTASVLFVAASGSYYVDVTNPQGCIGSDTINVTIASQPVVNLGGSITQCGGTVTLDAQNAGSSYMWSDASTAQTLVVSASGTYYVDVTSAPGCSSSDTVDVTINPIPTVTFVLPSDTVCVGASPVALSGGTPAGGIYTGTSVSGGNFDPAIGVGSYVITYMYTDVNSCSASDVQTMVVDACTGIAETKELSGIALYPNPTYGNFFLELKGLEGKVLTQIYTPEGKLMFAEQLNAATPRHGVSIASLPNGVYYVRLTSGSAVKTIKLVKQE